MAAPDVLTANEAEMYAQQLRIFDIKDIGNSLWLKQHEYIEKLNMQAHVSVTNQAEEFILETLISFDKIPVLIHELVAIELWRKKVYPLLKEMDFAKAGTMTPYIVLYHEATLINLLEAIMYHKEACEGAGDNILDLSDYCCRALTFLISREEEVADEFSSMSTKEILELQGQKHLDHQIHDLDFSISTKALSIIRYITDYLTSLSLSCMTRLLNTHDLPCLLVPLIVNPPWKRITKKGETEQFIDGSWRIIPINDKLKLQKLDAQVWLALYNLIMEPQCRSKYEFNSHNKQQLLRIRPYFNEYLIDQLPILGELRRTLEELSIMTPPQPQPSVVIEQVAEIWSGLVKINKNQWKEIAQYQIKTVFTADHDITVEQAKRLAATYNLDTLDSLFPEDPKCVVCGNAASKRCSRCHTEWYCRRQCQVEHWPKHKQICNMVSSAKTAGATSTSVTTE